MIERLLIAAYNVDPPPVKVVVGGGTWEHQRPQCGFPDGRASGGEIRPYNARSYFCFFEEP